jgi:hypothetical protein
VIEFIVKILLFLLEHPEIIVCISVFDLVGVVLLEWESKQYYKKHPEELEEELENEESEIVFVLNC